MTSRRQFIKGTAGLFVPAIPSLILPKEARAQLSGGLMFPGPGTPHTSGGAFTPASLTGALVWLTAGVGQTLSGANLNQWTDQISGVNFTPVVPNTTSPAYSATGFNTSFPGVTFAGGGSQIGLYSPTSGVVFGASQNAFSFACVANIDSTASNTATLLAVLAAGDSDENSGPHSINIRYLSGPAMMQVVQAGGGVANDAITTNANLRFVWVFDGTNESFYIGNVLQASNACNFNIGAVGSGNSGLGIADRIAGVTSDLKVVIAEVVVTKAALSSTDRTNLDNYFKTKWGL